MRNPSRARTTRAMRTTPLLLAIRGLRLWESERRRPRGLFAASRVIDVVSATVPPLDALDSSLRIAGTQGGKGLRAHSIIGPGGPMANPRSAIALLPGVRVRVHPRPGDHVQIAVALVVGGRGERPPSFWKRLTLTVAPTTSNVYCDEPAWPALLWSMGEHEVRTASRTQWAPVDLPGPG